VRSVLFCMLEAVEGACFVLEAVEVAFYGVGTGGDTLCAVDAEGCALCAGGVRCVLFSMLDAVEVALYLLEVMRCVL
jgi:hypothetical protein